MIRIDFQVGKEERLSARLMASAIRLNRDEDGVDLFQFLWIVELYDPSLLGGVVLVEDTEARSLLLVETTASPRLKCASGLEPVLLVKIVRIKDQRLSFGVEDPTIGLLRLTVARNVIDLGDVKVTSAHELADIPVVGQQFLLFAKLLLLVAKLTMQLPDLSRETVSARLLERTLPPEGVDLRLRLLKRRLRGIQPFLEIVLSLSDLLLRGRFTLERMLQFDLGTLHLV